MAAKKKFIEVEVPSLNTTLEVLGTAEDLHKKTIKLDLSRKLRGRGVEITLEMQNKEGKLIGLPKRIELMKSYIIRMLRKRISTVEDSFDIKCLDVEARIKPFLITRKKVSRVVRHNLRKNCKELLIEAAKDRNYLDLADEVLHGVIQKEIYPKLKKVYPLSLCEIRILETKELDNVKEQEKNQEAENIETEENIKPAEVEEVLDQAAEAEASKKSSLVEGEKKSSLVEGEKKSSIVENEEKPSPKKAEKTTKKKAVKKVKKTVKKATKLKKKDE